MELFAKFETEGQRFYTFLDLKEAYGKYTGKGLGTDFKKVQFRWDDCGNIYCSDEEVHVFQREVEEDYILSLCVKKSSGNHELTNTWIDDKIYTC